MSNDAQLLEAVVTALKTSSSAHARQIYVGVHGGVVTLSGFVSGRGDRAEVERIVGSIAGVTAVTLELSLSSPGCDVRGSAKAQLVEKLAV